MDRLTTCSPRYEQVASTDAADNVNGNGNNAAVEVILPDPVKGENFFICTNWRTLLAILPTI